MGGAPASETLTAADTALWARLNGVFWAAFLLFSWTTASIVSGSIIERVKSGAFWLIAVMLGSCHLDHRRRLGLALRPAGWCRCSAITTPMRRASCMPSPAAPASRC